MNYLELSEDLRDILDLHREGFQNSCSQNEKYKQVNEEENRLSEIIREKVEDHDLYLQWEEAMGLRCSIEDSYGYWQGMSDAVLLLKMMGVVE